MDAITARLTILFEDPFWIGLYERTEDGWYEVCKITFGAEPKDYEVYDFLMKNRNRFRFSPSVEAKACAERPINPKRMQRLINRQTSQTGIGTKAQQALKLQQEQGKQERKIRSRAQREAEEERRFVLHRQKQKEKHRGH